VQFARQSRAGHFENRAQEVGGRQLAWQPPLKRPSTTSAVNSWSARSWGSWPHRTQGTGVCSPGAALDPLAANLQLALELADEADRISLAYFRSDTLAVETKADMSPVSQADREVEQAIRGHLERERPGRFTDFRGTSTAAGPTAISSNGLLHAQVQELLQG